LERRSGCTLAIRTGAGFSTPLTSGVDVRDVLKVTLPKAKIMAMPERERAMFLLLGYAANQVAFYTKLAILSTNYELLDIPCMGRNNMVAIGSTVKRTAACGETPVRGFPRGATAKILGEHVVR
jgi:hypothetical protein